MDEIQEAQSTMRFSVTRTFKQKHVGTQILSFTHIELITGISSKDMGRINTDSRCGSNRR